MVGGSHPYHDIPTHSMPHIRNNPFLLRFIVFNPNISYTELKVGKEPLLLVNNTVCLRTQQTNRQTAVMGDRIIVLYWMAFLLLSCSTSFQANMI